MIAWAWRQYLQDKDQDARWLPRLPMVKAAFACMKAATEWLDKTGMAQIDGWVVSGASKRGWTTWMVGATAPVCSWCPKVIGITPLVPIVPYLNHSVHLQRQSLGGFTFAFRDYLDAGVLDAFGTIVRHEGVLALYKGFVPIVVRKVLWCSAFFLCYERLRVGLRAREKI